MKKFAGALEGASTKPAPDIEAYLPGKGHATGMAIVILPGGGYSDLAEHEGKGYAEFFQKEGIAAFVVTYRLSRGGHRHPAMLEDALAAVGAVRSRAAEFGLNPNRIGLMGSSAGGHLTAHALVAYGKYRTTVSIRPDFGILCYPVISMTTSVCHTGSRDNLLGADSPDALRAQVSPELHVSAQTPPCFIWHTWEDDGVPVENSMLFASALRANRVPFELHVYQKGGHGLGLNTDLPWGAECLRWLKGLG